MPDIIGFMPERAFTLTGQVAGGAAYTVEFFDSGTTTPATVYQDDAETVPHTQPIAANANGVFPKVVATGALKAVVKTAAGATVATVDPCWRSALSASSAENISFAPTDDVVATNVYDAILYVADYFSALGRDLVADVTAADMRTTIGLGSAISSDATSVTDADSATSNGFYTLATPFTNGPTAAAYRILSVRGSASEITQIAFLAASASAWYRTRTGGSWGSWAQIMNSASEQQVGVGQTWQDVSGSRSVGVSYQNETGKPIMVNIGSSGGSTQEIQVSANGSDWVSLMTFGSGPGNLERQATAFIVPDDHYYRLLNGSAAFSWAELR